MDETTLPLLIQDHAHFPTGLLNLFQGVPEDVLREREAEGRWSPLEILAHLRDEEILDFRVRARAAIEGTEIALNVDPERWVAEKRYNEMDPGAVFLDFASERADSCRWLTTLTPGDLRERVTVGKLQGMRAGDFIAAWRVHDLLHLRQFAQALALLHVRQFDGWAVRYAGTIPEPAS